MDQLGLPLFDKKKRGGARPGAGRKKKAGALRNTPHRSRSKHRKSNPVHVTLRSKFGLLRRQRVARAVLGALRDSNAEAFRIAHYSVQHNHLHLIVEAECDDTLSSGMRGLMVRLAKRLNRLLSRRGRFWADRWHGRELASPREVRNALVYVLHNHKKHDQGRVVAALDPLSSAAGFDGFAEGSPPSVVSVGPPCAVAPQTWLLRVGWRRHGLIRRTETPKRVAHG